MNDIHDEFFVWEPILSTNSVVQGKTVVVSTPGIVEMQFRDIARYAVVLYDINGAAILERTIDNQNGRHSLIHDLPAGTYFIKITNLDQGSNETKKLLIN